MTASPRIAYVGGFGLPDRTASAQRVRSNARLFQAAGAEVVIIGKLPDGVHRMEIDGFSAIDIQSPHEGADFPAYANDPTSILSVLDEAGPFDVMIAYNASMRSLPSLLDAAAKRGIATVIELTDYHGFNGSNLYGKIAKGLNTRRLLKEARNAPNVIVASRYCARMLGAENTLRLPLVVDPQAGKWPETSNPGDVRRFVYAGSPAAKFTKDRVDRVIEGAMQCLEDGRRLSLSIVGITCEQFLVARPDLRARVENHADAIRFHGRVPHDRALAEVAKADFSLLVRESTLANEIGFPTKLGESFACGTPGIANATSDIAEFVRTDETGILLNSTSLDDVAAGIGRACEMPRETIAEMKRAVRSDNPFDYRNFVTEAERFLAAMKVAA